MLFTRVFFNQTKKDILQKGESGPIYQNYQQLVEKTGIQTVDQLKMALNRIEAYDKVNRDQPRFLYLPNPTVSAEMDRDRQALTEFVIMYNRLIVEQNQRCHSNNAIVLRALGNSCAHSSF